MTFGEQMGECLRSKIVRIVILVLLLILIGVGAFLLLRSSSDSNNADEKSLEFSPKINGGNFVHYQPYEKKSVDVVTKVIEEYLKPYNVSSPNIQKPCSFYNPPAAGKTCEVDLQSFSPCIKEHAFEYYTSQPCVFLKLKKQADWVPKFYDESELPKAMPVNLQQLIRSYVKNDAKNAQFIWVSCDGKSAEDKLNIGDIRFLPRPGFPGYFYPCTSQEGCNEPLIAVQFLKPKVGEKIYVECKIWSKNVEDTVDFELMVER